MALSDSMFLKDEKPENAPHVVFDAREKFGSHSYLLVVLLLSPPTTCVLMPYFIIRLLSFQTAINANAINYVATISMFRFIKFDVVVLHATAKRER